jgi:inorganic pyrophosphatase
MAELTAGKNVPDVVNAVIEISKGNRNKYELDKETGHTILDRVIPVAMVYPIDYGYVPNTLCDDGDALDVLLVIDEPVPSGIVVPARPIGLLRMVDDGEADEKLVCVAKDDITKEHIKSVEDLGPNFKQIIEHFFKHYKDFKNDWKGVDVHFDGWAGADEAKKFLVSSIERYKG